MTVRTSYRDLATIEGLNATALASVLASTIVDQVTMSRVGPAYNPPFSVKTSRCSPGSASKYGSYSGEIAYLPKKTPSCISHVLLLFKTIGQNFHRTTAKGLSWPGAA